MVSIYYPSTPLSPYLHMYPYRHPHTHPSVILPSLQQLGIAEEVMQLPTSTAETATRRSSSSTTARKKRCMPCSLQCVCLLIGSSECAVENGSANFGG